jgi:murein L,D-transpeptidase YafK
MIGLICTGAWPAQADQATRLMQADRIHLDKSDRRMLLLRDGRVIRAYQVSLGPHPEGTKTRRGDGRTPEGRYIISGRNRHSRFHRALRISYPDRSDKARARSLGADPGGDIMIHGLPGYAAFLGSLHRLHDWTRGCIAVTNEEMEEIWALVPDGTVIEIEP